MEASRATGEFVTCGRVRGPSAHRTPDCPDPHGPERRLGQNAPFRPSALTREDYARAARYQPTTALPRVKNQNVAAHWIGRSDELWYVREQGAGWQYVLVDALPIRSPSRPRATT